MNLSSTIMTSLKNDNPEILKKIIYSIPKSELIASIEKEIKYGKSETIELLLNLKVPLDVFTKNNSLDEYLHKANIHLCILLLQNGADVNTCDEKQQTLLMKTGFYCTSDAIKMTTEILKFNPNLYLKDIFGNNAFDNSIKECVVLLYKHIEQCNLTKIKNLEELNKKQQTENLDLKKENSELKDIIMTKYNVPPRPPPPPVQEQWELIHKSDNEHEHEIINNVSKPIESEPQSIESEPQPIKSELQTIESEPQPIKSEPQPIVIIQKTFLQKKQEAEEVYKKNCELKEKGFYDIYLTNILTIISNMNKFNGGKFIVEIKDKIYCHATHNVETYIIKLKETNKIDKNILFSVYMENNITCVEFEKAK